MWRRRPAREWLLEAALAVVAVLIGVFFLVTSVSTDGGAPAAWEITGAVLSVGALVLFRRSRPVALTLCLIPAGILLALPMGATMIALFAVALHRPARTAVAVGTVHAAAVVVVYRLALADDVTYRDSVIFMVLVHAVVLAVGMLIRSQRMLVRSWADRARQAEEGQRMRIDQARLAERERIAREMHDVLAHRISLLAVHAGALEVRRSAPVEERQAAGVIRRCAYEALEDLRQVLGMLRDTAPDDRPQPTLADVPELVAQSRQAGARVSLESAAAGPVPDGVGRHAYRIVQEALTNARKHAPGAPVRVAVRGCAADGLVVEVGNDLVRAGAAMPGAGAGLIGLRERVGLAGGRLEHGPTAAGGFEVRAWLPWRP